MSPRTTRRLSGGSVSLRNRGMRGAQAGPGCGCTPPDVVSPRTTPRRSRGTVSRRNRGMRARRPTWVGCTDDGRGVPQDDAEAVRWYRSCCGTGTCVGAGQPGWLYVTGRGVPQDDAEAVRWFRLAAEQGDADAQFDLGVMYRKGAGVPRTTQKQSGGIVLLRNRGLRKRSPTWV